VPSGLVERGENEAGQIFAPLTHAAQHLQIVLIKCVLRSFVAGFVPAKPEDDEVHATQLQLALDVRGVVVEQPVGARANQSE